jgi:hypothetical protein
MLSQPSLQPPRLASWLVDLFTPYDQVETIPGDIYEEFVSLASERGLSFARHWYWHQSLKTIAHLTLAAFRTSVWNVAGAVVAGILLMRFALNLSGQIQFTLLHVSAYYFDPVGVGIVVEVLLGLLIGLIVAALAKDNELVAALTLSLCLVILTGILLRQARFVSPYAHPERLPMLLFMFDDPMTFVLGAVIIRDIRLARLRKRAHA